MTQVGESVAAIPSGGEEKCVFCGKEHQQEEAEEKVSFDRDMKTLKDEGRAYTIQKYSTYYPGTDIPPLVDWSGKDIEKVGGYKAAAHHCIALTSINQHKISGELKEAGYDPNRGSNCAWLPYSKLQFSRARAYRKPLQKHRGGHTNAYFSIVSDHIEAVEENVATDFCFEDETTDKEYLLFLMELEEHNIWRGIANPRMKEYRLYNNSYLDPDEEWGNFEWEEGKTREEVIATPTPIQDDNAAEADSAEDPETIAE